MKIKNVFCSQEVSALLAYSCVKNNEECETKSDD